MLLRCNLKAMPSYLPGLLHNEREQPALQAGPVTSGVPDEVIKNARKTNSCRKFLIPEWIKKGRDRLQYSCEQNIKQERNSSR